MELLRRYFAAIKLPTLIRERLGRHFGNRDFPAASMVLLLIILIIGGGRRIRHLGFLDGDPVILRFCGLARLPTDRTVNRWLAQFDEKRLNALRSVNDRVSENMLRASRLKSLTLDIDGTVVSTGLSVAGAKRGFNPHNRKRPSYYPISAYAAELGTIARLENRPGNVHDGKASLPFFNNLLDQFRPHTDEGLELYMRMDAAFFRDDLLELLAEEEVKFAVKVPFWEKLNLRGRIAANPRWRSINADIGYFETTLEMARWEQQFRVIIFRKRVHHESRKNYQLDLFDPNDGHWEYSAVASNIAVSGKDLWYFMCGRSAHEKAYGELKSGFALACIPSLQQHANSAWQQLSVLSFNLTRAFQAATIAPKRPSNGKRTTIFKLSSIQTLRYELFNRAGVVVNPFGKATLDVGSSPAVVSRFQSISDKLQKAA